MDIMIVDKHGLVRWLCPKVVPGSYTWLFHVLGQRVLKHVCHHASSGPPIVD